MRLFGAILISLALISCSAGKQQAESNKNYLAKVNNHVITEEQVREELNYLPDQVKAMFMQQGPEALLQQLINKELLYQQAEKSGYDKDKRLKTMMDDFKKVTMVRLFIQDKIEKQTAVSDDEAKQFYDANKAKFKMTVPGSKKPQELGFDQVKDMIKQKLAGEKQEKAFNAYIADLRKNSKIEINEAALQKMGGQPEGAPSNAPTAAPAPAAPAAPAH